MDRSSSFRHHSPDLKNGEAKTAQSNNHKQVTGSVKYIPLGAFQINQEGHSRQIMEYDNRPDFYGADRSTRA